MWDGMFPEETERALEFRVRNPVPPKPAKASIWGQAAELLAAPLKGTGQAGLQTARAANTVAPLSVGNPLAMGAAEQEDLLQDADITREGQDRALRGSIESLRPDPVTATAASRFLQEGSRVVSKALFYGATGGPAGAVVGTGVDEGITGAQELRDQGVDPATAAKVGAVRGITMGAGVALPVVGQTALRTAGLVVIGGPGTYIAEQAISRAILERADYSEIARQYDPFDPMGLGLSVAVPGVLGVVLHRARAGAGQSADKEARALDDLARDGDMVDAALVTHRSQTINANALGDMSRPDVANSHIRALDEAARAMDDGAPVHINDVVVEPAAAARMLTELDSRLTTARAALEADPDLQVQKAMSRDYLQKEPGAPAVQPDLFYQPEPRLAFNGQGTRNSTPEVQRAEAIAARQPDMPVRLDDDGSAPQRASDLMDLVRKESQHESAEARKAFEAAVHCFLEVGA